MAFMKWTDDKSLISITLRFSFSSPKNMLSKTGLPKASVCLWPYTVSPSTRKLTSLSFGLLNSNCVSVRGEYDVGAFCPAISNEGNKPLNSGTNFDLQLRMKLQKISNENKEDKNVLE